jgi:hypothetical protein
LKADVQSNISEIFPESNHAPKAIKMDPHMIDVQDSNLRKEETNFISHTTQRRVLPKELKKRKIKNK